MAASQPPATQTQTPPTGGAPASAPPAAPVQLAALASATPPYRHVAGDLVFRFYTVSGNNGDTLTVPGMSVIYQADPVPTTAINVGVTVTGNTITFVTSGAFTAVVMVVGREG